MRGGPERARIADRERRDGRVRLRAVDEGDALFRRERERREAGLGEHRRGGAGAVATMEFALADEREREMRERREVAARADGPLLGNGRPEVGVEHRAEESRHVGARAREALRDDVRAEEHHRAHFALRERRTHAARVAADEIHLQRGELVARDRHLAQFAEARRDAVHHLVSLDDAGDDVARDHHAVAGGGVEGDGRLPGGHRADVGDGEGAAVDGDGVRIGHGTVVPGCR